MNSGDEAAAGRQAIATGRVSSLRDTFNLSWPVMANLIGVDATSLRMWCAGTREPSHASAQKLGAWVSRVQLDGPITRYRPDELVSLSMASQYLGMSYATVLEKCRTSELTCVDLGPLGVFILKSDIPTLEENRGQAS